MLKQTMAAAGIALLIALPTFADDAVSPARPASPTSPASESADPRDAIEQARSHLDRAAQHFAELHARFGFDGQTESERRAFLGVVLQPSGKEGVVVGGVTPGSGAERAGVQSGDVITAVAGQNLTGRDNAPSILMETMAEIEPGDIVTLTVLRDGVMHNLDVETGKQGIHRIVKMVHDGLFDWKEETSAAIANLDIDMEGIGKHMRFARAMGPDGLQLVDVNAGLGSYFGVESGALVVDSTADGELRAGDVIQAIGDTVIHNAGEAYGALNNLEGVTTAQVVRQQASLAVTVAPPAAMQMHGADGPRQIFRMFQSDGDGVHVNENIEVRVEQK